MTLDIQSARRSRPYSPAEYAGRLAWAIASPLFRFSPRLMYGWRRGLLRMFGARIGHRVNIAPSARIALPWMLEAQDDCSIGDRADIYNLGRIVLGARSSVSQQAYLCAASHDHRDPALPLQRLPIQIGPDAWICARAFIGPRVVVGQGAVVGAASVAMRDVPAWEVFAGNPALRVGRRQMRATGKEDGDP